MLPLNLLAQFLNLSLFILDRTFLNALQAFSFLFIARWILLEYVLRFVFFADLYFVLRAYFLGIYLSKVSCKIEQKHIQHSSTHAHSSNNKYQSISDNVSLILAQSARSYLKLEKLKPLEIFIEEESFTNIVSVSGSRTSSNKIDRWSLEPIGTNEVILTICAGLSDSIISRILFSRVGKQTSCSRELFVN